MNAVGKAELQYYLGLGSNIEPEKHLPLSIGLLRQFISINAISSVWETPSVGKTGPNFLNAVIGIKSDLPPDKLKHQVLRPVEARLGRVRTSDKYAPRPIDIDILVANSIIYNHDVWKYAYLAIPLAELVPHLTHSPGGKTLAEIADQLRHSTKILPRPDVLLGVIL